MKNKEILTNFEKGQIDGLNYVKENLQREIAQIQNGGKGYLLRDLEKDPFKAIKLAIHLKINTFLLSQVNEKIEEIIGE